MINDQLLSYIKQQLAKNVPKEIIANNLKSQGWTDADVGEAFGAIAPSLPVTPSPAPVAPMASSMTTNIGQMPAQPAANFSSPKPHKSRKALLFSSILLLLILAGGGAYAYYSGFLNFNKADTLEEVVTEAINKISSERYIKNTSEVDVTIKDEKIITQFNLPAGAYPKIQFSSNAFLSKEDLNDPSKNKVSMNAKFNFANILEEPISAEVDFLIPEPMIFYVKLTELTGLPEGAPSLSASLFQGKWWKIDVETLIENFAGMGAEEIQASFKNNQPSKEELEKIEVILKKYLSIVQAEKLADSSIDGDSAYRWRIDFEKKQFVDMFMEILEVTGKDSTGKIGIQTPEVKASIESSLNLIDIKPIEILVKKAGYLPLQVKFSLGILDEDGTNIADVDITYTTTSSEPIKIEAPAESTDILYLLGPIVQSSLDSARQKGKDASIKANMSSLRVQGELFWDDNNGYSGFCLSKELKDTRKSIEGSGSTGFVCKDSVKAYAISTKLLQTGYWCVDSSGASKATSTASSGTTCPAK